MAENCFALYAHWVSSKKDDWNKVGTNCRVKINCNYCLVRVCLTLLTFLAWISLESYSYRHCICVICFKRKGSALLESDFLSSFLFRVHPRLHHHSNVSLPPSFFGSCSRQICQYELISRVSKKELRQPGWMAVASWSKHHISEEGKKALC